MLRLVLLIIVLSQNSFVASIPTEKVNIDSNSRSSKTLECPINTGGDGEDTEFAQWYTTGRTEDGTEKEIIYEKDHFDFPTLTSLTIENLSGLDEGWYYCKIAFTDTKIKNFHITILEDTPETTAATGEQGPEWLQIPSPQQTYDSGRSIIIPCRVTDSSIKVAAFRLRPDGVIMRKLRDQGVVIHKPSQRDAGNYMCVAENSGGKIEHKFSIKIRQHGGFSNWGEWSKCDAECGNGYKLRKRECNNPPPSGGGRSCYGRTAEHNICRERSCQLPRLTKFGFELTDKQLILNCGAKGFPKPTAAWTVNGKDVPIIYYQENDRVLIPRSKTKSLSGLYRCKLQNSAGYFTMSMNIEE